MRIATFLVCLLGAASARLLSNAADGNDPECEACVASVVSVWEIMREPSYRAKLKEHEREFKEFVCHQVQRFEVSRSECLELADDETFARSINHHVENAKRLCGLVGERCTRKPSSLLQFAIGRFKNLFTNPYGFVECDNCKSKVTELWTLLGNQDAQNELKGYAKASCRTAWDLRLALFTFDGPATPTALDNELFMLKGLALIMHMIPPTAGVDWCSEGIDQYWTEIVETLRWTIVDSHHFCADINSCSYYSRYNWRDITRNRYATDNSDRYLTVVNRIVDHTVGGYKTLCVLCQLGTPRVRQASQTFLASDFIQKANNGDVNKICDVIGAQYGLDQAKIENCRRNIATHYVPQIFENYAGKVKEIYANVFSPPCEGGREGCTTQQVANLRGMSESDRLALSCDTCKYVISSAKEGFKNERVAKGVTDNSLQFCAPKGIYGMFKECTVVVEKFLPDYLAKLAEHMNEHHVCSALNMCPRQ